MSAQERIQQETEQWFLTEPLFFNVYCTHKLAMNPKMQCTLRTGKGRIEYNPTLVDLIPNSVLKDKLRVEVVRILLGHPYARQPLGCNPLAMNMASDMVIKTAYHLAWLDLASPSDFDLPEGQCYEWYAMRLNDLIEHQDGDQASEGYSDTDKQQGEGAAGSSDYTALWEEDAFQSCQITGLIQSTTQWGSLPADMIELIKKSTEGRIDYRNALRGFRASILSQKRRLTRMRPSRRFGFEQMGSRYDFITRLLVAIDTSGSVGSEELGRYFNVITTFFKYGIQQVDVLMFDAAVQGDVMQLDEAKKRKQEFKIQGRGGTDFQAPVDYLVEHPEYDGMIIITDGYAPVPEIPPLCKAKLLWIIDNEAQYQQYGKALRKTGRVCLMQV